MTIVLTEVRHSGGYLVSEAVAERSRDQVTLLQQTYSEAPNVTPAGTILGEVLDGTSGTYAANAGNTGNFTCSAITLGQGVEEGVYGIEFIAPTVFNVTNPAGELVGEGATGVAFNKGGLEFTLTAGGTAAVAGDGATITIAANANVGLFNALSLTAADGTQIPAAILYNTTYAGDGNVAVAVHTRDCEVNGSELVYPAGATDNQIAAINAQLKTLGIVVR